MTPQKKQVVIAGNFNGEAKEVTVKLGKSLFMCYPAGSLTEYIR